MTALARRVRIRGIVQGVGFRPFLYRLAHEHGVGGWVLNAGDGVEAHVEGDEAAVTSFLSAIAPNAPPASSIAGIEIVPDTPTDSRDFAIRASRAAESTTARVSPDLPVCARCLAELRAPTDRRFGYPYINCTDCGPRYSIIESVPYDRAATTMRGWPMCDACAAEYRDPSSRRFHAEPNACPRCGPRYIGVGADPIAAAAVALTGGAIIAIKGIGGYHLACDAANGATVAALRTRKFRKERPFAVMVADLDTARRVAVVSAAAAELLMSPARPIVLLPARLSFDGVAPGNRELGVMLPNTPVHHLLFDHGAPQVLVMTSANRSSEPIAYRDDDARERLAGIADIFLVGERPIARREDDSVVRPRGARTMMVRRSRGYAPASVARIPSDRPILALGGDLKNTVTLVADGEAFVSQHLGDLEQVDAFDAFRAAVTDLLAMHGIASRDLAIVADAHPEYRATGYARELPGAEVRLVQHHRAHVASVLAERGEFERRVVGIACDGTGYGDDGTIWGGEFFLGSVASGFERVGHLLPARLPGGDAAAKLPAQAAAGFVSQLADAPDAGAEPFGLPARYDGARKLLRSDIRVFETTSFGRLFDAAAALTGFRGPVSFEGQAAIWLEQLARTAGNAGAYPFPFDGQQLDYRPLLGALIADRRAGRDACAIARAFHDGVAAGVVAAAARLGATHGVDTVVLSGGVFQNALLLDAIESQLTERRLRVWLNAAVPPNDGGLSLGQAALAAFGQGTVAHA